MPMVGLVDYYTLLFFIGLRMPWPMVGLAQAMANALAMVLAKSKAMAKLTMDEALAMTSAKFS